MKSIASLQQIAISTILLISGLRAFACGPYYPQIPTPDLFYSFDYKSMAQYEREENLRLWQDLTSKKIPLSDIEQVVYRDKLDDYYMYFGSGPAKTKNRFYAYINNSNNNEIEYFLYVAKRLEEFRGKLNSPWYYPRKRYPYIANDNFDNIIETIGNYKGTLLKDRYALQMVRALFASHQYADCVVYYDSVFCNFPASNLLKRMAQRYVAGCWTSLNNSAKANIMYAEAEDIQSITEENPVIFMLKHNPNAPQIMDYVRYRANDTLFMTNLVPAAKLFLANQKVTNKGDWNFALAYYYNEYANNPKKAKKYIYRAVNNSFSSQELSDLAKAYKMTLDAITLDKRTLLADLKWIEEKTDILNPDAYEWLRILRQIIYRYWTPVTWKHGDYSTSILLCAYADNIHLINKKQKGWDIVNPLPELYSDLTLKEMRNSEIYENFNDYSNLSFQMMGSLSSSQLIAAYKKMREDIPLNNFLRRIIRSDNDYYYELIGTLSLREENYDRAIQYLSQVSHKYQRTMNIFKYRYLTRKPFELYQSRWSTFESEYSDYCYDYDHGVCWHPYRSQIDAKLNFAKQMNAYKHKMLYGRNGDERGKARAMYAIGRFNSFEECWALTQYWRGSVGLFIPNTYEDNEFGEKNYGFLYDYVYTVGHKNTEEIYNREIELALNMMETDEARAETHYILGNLKTIIKRYNDTSTARFVKSSCDNWKSWI